MTAEFCFVLKTCAWLLPRQLENVLSCSVVSGSLHPHWLEPARLLCPWDIFWQEYYSVLLFPPPGDLPDPGIEPSSFTSPTFFTTSATWEAPSIWVTAFNYFGHIYTQKWNFWIIYSFHGQRSLVGYSPWGHKESNTTEWLTHILILCLIIWGTTILLYTSGCANLLSYQQCTQVLIFPHPCQHLLLRIFWFITILQYVK